MEGWIKLHRKIVEWEWFDDPHTLKMFLYLLSMANHKDGRWQGIDVKRGQHITGRKKLAKALRRSERSIRTSLNKLKSTNEITIKATNRYSIITIANYNTYNDKETCNDQPSANQAHDKRPANDQQTTTNNNEKNEKNEKEEYLCDSKEMILSTLMHTMMTANNNKTRPPNFQQWCDDINKLHRIDGNSYEDIEKIIRWTQHDDFEKTNVLSPSKLRKRFPDLWMKGKGKAGKNTMTDDDIDKAFGKK